MTGGDFAEGAMQGAWTSAMSVIAENIVTNVQDQENPWREVDDNTGGCYECLRLTESEFMPGNHSYLWNDLDGVGDGMTRSSGTGPDTIENGPMSDACFFIEGSRGIEGLMMQHMHAIRNNGIWTPLINDCHIKVDNVINHFELRNPNAPGRFDRLPPPGRYAR